MPRTARSICSGGIYHVLNRGNSRMDVFHKPADFAAFLDVLTEGLERYPVVTASASVEQTAEGSIERTNTV